MIWDHSDYMREVEKQLSDKTIYRDVTLNSNIIPNLTKKINKILENLEA